jgi:hypothetical protein
MVAKLKPQVVHTHSALYLKLLQYINIEAKKLKIFSNIPIIHNQLVSRELMSDGTLKFLVFGYISPNAPVDLFISELKKCADSIKIELEFVFSGRNGGSLQVWIDSLEKHKIKYEVLGVLSIEELSDLMIQADIGISTTPYYLYEKSGSVAAMFKHGLPVINVAESIEWDPIIIADFIPDPIIVEFVPGMIDHWIKNLSKPERKNILSSITSQFCEDLNISIPVNSLDAKHEQS